MKRWIQAARHFVGPKATYFLRPAAILANYTLADLQPDLMAGLTVGALLLPQAIAFALIAGLPPQMGIYSAIVGASVAAMWGSSAHMNSGPTNTSSLLVFTTLSAVVAAGSDGYVAAAALLAVMVGIFRLLVGLAGLGRLANFVSDAVIIGFSAGAGVLIGVGQLPNLLGVTGVKGSNVFVQIELILLRLPEVQLPTLAMGAGSILLLLVLQKRIPKAPGPLLTIVTGVILVALLNLEQMGLRIIGPIPRSLPSLTIPPLFDLALIGQLSSGALALAAIGLVEASSIARSISASSGQRLDSNQEFVGQGLAALASGFFGGYSGSASFNRSAINYGAGARTGVSGLISGMVVLAAVLALAPAVALIPMAALAGILMVIAYRMTNVGQMMRVWRANRADGWIMLFTFGATLLLPLQFAVLSGILVSLGAYLLDKSVPQILPVLPTADFKHFLYQPEKEPCPQLGIISVLGDFYFGAAHYVEERMLAYLQTHPQQIYLLLRMQNVNIIDVSGVQVLESLVLAYRARGGDVYFMKTKASVYTVLESAGLVKLIGPDRFLDDDGAIGYLFSRVLDPVTCIYDCPLRVFQECQNLPKLGGAGHIASLPVGNVGEVPTVTPLALWQEQRGGDPPTVLDVREPWEFARGHIPEALLTPLSRFSTDDLPVSPGSKIVVTCRTGRRSQRVARSLLSMGYTHVRYLEGGAAAWEEAALLTAVESPGSRERDRTG